MTAFKKKKPKWKVQGIWEGSFNDTLAKLHEAHRDMEVQDAILVFRRLKPEGGYTVYRNFFGDPWDCHGLVKFASKMLDNTIEEGVE